MTKEEFIEKLTYELTLNYALSKNISRDPKGAKNDQIFKEIAETSAQIHDSLEKHADEFPFGK